MAEVQRATLRRRSREAPTGAAAAFVVATRTAAATHHSAQQNAAPRGPKDRRQSQGGGGASYARRALRAQTAPPLGGAARHPRGSLGRRGVTAACGTPQGELLLSRWCRWLVGDAPDDATVAFLLSAALGGAEGRREEEVGGEGSGSGLGRGGFVAAQPQGPGWQYAVFR